MVRVKPAVVLPGQTTSACIKYAGTAIFFRNNQRRFNVFSMYLWRTLQNIIEKSIRNVH